MSVFVLYFEECKSNWFATETSRCRNKVRLCLTTTNLVFSILLNKDKISEEHQSKENLLAENKMLKKQKAELVVGFKKQLKLIDILKKQKVSVSSLP